MATIPYYINNNSNQGKLEEKNSSPAEGCLALPRKLAENKVGHTSKAKMPSDSLSDEDFFE